MNIPDSELTEWRDGIRKGIVKMRPEESMALLDELIRLRATVRRMEAKVLKATQTTSPLGTP